MSLSKIISQNISYRLGKMVGLKKPTKRNTFKTK